MNKMYVWLTVFVCVSSIVLASAKVIAYDYSEQMECEKLLPLTYPTKPFVFRFSQEDLLKQPVWSKKVDVIVISKTAPSCVRIGAEALQKTVSSLGFGKARIVEIDPKSSKLRKALSGRNLIVMGSPANNKVISSLVAKHHLNINDKALNGDGYVIRSVNNAGRRILLVAASSDRGVMYGTYEIEERTTKKGVPLINDTFIPKVKFRSWPLHAFTDQPDSMVGRLRLNVSLYFDIYWPSTLFYNEFPEMEGEKNRELILSQQQKLHKKFANAIRYGSSPAMVFEPMGFISCPKGMSNHDAYREALSKSYPGILATPGAGRCNLCPSSPATRRFVVAGVKELVTTFPELDILILMFSDMHGELNCNCDQCKKYPLVDRIVDYGKLVMDTARSVNPKIRFLMREHALPMHIALYQPEYKNDPTVGFKDITRRLGPDVEAIIGRQTTPPGADFQSWTSPDSTFLGHGIPLYFLFHYTEAGGPGVLGPISPVMSHLSWPLPLYLRKLNKYLEPGQGLVGCTSPVDGVEVALWHPKMDAHKYMRNWCQAKYGKNAGNNVFEALEDTDRITTAFILEGGRRSESYQMYRWQEPDNKLDTFNQPTVVGADRRWAVDMQPVIKAGFGSMSNYWMQPIVRQTEDIKRVTRGDLQKWIARFELKEESAIAARAEQKTATALAMEPSNEELQRFHSVAVATNHLVGLFKDYHQALVYANAAKNERASGDGATEDLVALSRKHIKDAIIQLKVYVDTYREIADKSKSFQRLDWDIMNAYVFTDIAMTREACYLFDKDFGGDSTLRLLDEKLIIK